MTNLELRIVKQCRVKDFSIPNFQFSILPFIIALLLFYRSATAETLGFNFKPGDKYFLSSVIEEKVTKTIDPNEQVVNRTTRFESDFDIDEVDENGLVWAKYTYRRTALKWKGPDIDIDFDSTVENKKLYTVTLPLILVVGEGLYIKIKPQGRVLQINGLQAVVSDVKSNIPKITDRDRLSVINSIDEMLSESTIKRTLEEQLAVFPDSNQNPEWTRTAEVPSTKIVQKWDYQLKNVKDGIAEVDVDLDITPSANIEEVVRGGVKYRRQTLGQGRGQIEIDLNATDARPIIKSVITQDLMEELKGLYQGPVLRVPQITEPIQAHIVTTFLMTRREPPAKNSEPNQPMNANR
jgi:hypothetical protein